MNQYDETYYVGMLAILLWSTRVFQMDILSLYPSLAQGVDGIGPDRHTVSFSDKPIRQGRSCIKPRSAITDILEA